MTNYTPQQSQMDYLRKRGLLGPQREEELTEDQAESVVEQQVPEGFFDPDWKCPRIDKLPRF